MRTYASRREYILNWRKNTLSGREAVRRGNASPAHKAAKDRYWKRNPEQLKAKWRRANKRPMKRLRHCLYSRMRNVLRGRVKAGPTLELLGCTTREFRIWLETKFSPGMSWANRHLWHIDHKKPLASFDLSDESQQRMAFHFTNCQPLWAGDNLRKGAAI